MMARLRSPIIWFGGKGNMIAKLLPLIPEHRIYCEAFGGGASLLLAHPPSLIEIYNDLDGRLINLFRVLRDRGQFQELERLATLTLNSRQEYMDASKRLDAGGPIERAWAFYIASRQSFSGNLESWGYSRTAHARGMAQKCSRWIGSISQLPEIHARLQRVQIEHDDWRKILERYDTADTFFYLDPPYVLATRRSGGYAHELSDDDHRELVERLLALKGKILLSGYPNELYAPLERGGWHKVAWKVGCHAVGRTRANGLIGKGTVRKNQSRTECVWMNY